LHGCAWLGGIGFTMSLFIATLAFEGTTLLDSVKVGILGGSILSGIAGAIIVRRGTRSRGLDERHDSPHPTVG
jgi:NhaA family Na+:H+ antiporter